MILVVGLDGATFDLLTPWIEAGHLPTIARLMQQGSAGPLTSVIPPVTPPAWASFMTGKNPGKHGIFDFFHPRSPDLDQPQMVNFTDVRSRPFWEYLSAAGWQVGILNLPLTYPPPPLNGFLVPGLLSPDEGQTTHPPDLLSAYTPELGPYRLVPHALDHLHRVDEFLADLRAVTETQIRYALRLAQDHQPDFLMVHFFAPDIAQHKLWRYLDPTHPWYQPEPGRRYGTAVRDLFTQFDAGLARLLAHLPPDPLVILMSDHGFGPQHEVVNLNNIFIRAGLMALKPAAAVRLRAWAFRRRRLGRAATRLARVGGRSRLLSFADVDWPRTVAYSFGHMGQVYLNLAGREPQGAVAPADYTAVRDQIITLLRSLRRPADGRPLVNQIIPREEAVHGPYLAAGPDLHLIMDEYRALAYPLFAADGEEVTQQPLADSGTHRPQGILVAAGPGIRHGRVHHARLIDLAPTLLHLSRLSVPDDMDGRVLTPLFTDDFNRQHPVTTFTPPADETAHTSLDPAQQATLAERLRALGYLGG